MDLRELGSLLREERERQGLSVIDVSERIKISRACLTAIEEGDESQLPHPVYAKGFVKNYAGLLGLDPVELGERLSRVYAVSDDHAINMPEPGERVDPPRRAPSFPAAGGKALKFGLLAVAGLMVLAAVLWFFLLRSPAPDRGAGAPAPAGQAAAPEPARPAPIAPEPIRPVAPEPVAAPKDTAAARPVDPVQATPEPAPTPTVPPAPSSPLPQTELMPPAPAAAPTETVIGDAGAHRVEITANEECWYEAGIDGGAMKEGRLAPGQRLTGRFGEVMLIRLGNAGAVRIRFNGADYPLQAAKGEVKTLRFTAKKTPGQDKPAETAQKPAETAPAPTAPPAKPLETAAPAAPAAAAPADPGSGKRLDIVGADGSWVMIITDGGPAKEVYVKKGQTISSAYNDKIEVRLGNPSSVIFRHEGKEIPMSTERGESGKSVRFP